MTRRTRIFLSISAFIGAVGLLLIVTAFTVLPSAWFRNKVRDRIVYEVERASGGRTEIGSFRFDWTTMTAEVAPFVLHGTEPPGEEPLFRAESVRVGLKIVSVFKRDVDLDLVFVEQPKINILIDESGITNFPRPKIQRRNARDPIEQLLALKINRIELRRGTVHYGDRKLPLDLRGHTLTAKLAYDTNGPSYLGDVAMEEMTVDAGPVLPMTFSFGSRVLLARNRVVLTDGHLAMKDTRIAVAGSVDDFKNPRMEFEITATGAMKDIGKPLKLPLLPEGSVAYTGNFTYSRPEGIRMAGRVTGQHLQWREGRWRLNDISLAGDAKLTGREVELRNLVVHALDGVFRGAVDVNDFRTFKVNGALTGVSVRSVTRMAGFAKAGFAGTVAGPVEVRGSFASLRDLKAGGRFNVAASQGGVPLQGFVEAAYNGAKNTIQLGNSELHMPASTVAFQGTFGENMNVRLRTADLNDLMPALAFVSEAPPEKLPLTLRPGGSVAFDGSVKGPTDRAQVAGTVTLTSAEVAGQTVDRVAATVEANASTLRATGITLGQDTLRLTGDFEASLQNWKLDETSALRGSLRVTNARIRKLLESTGTRIDADGLASAAATISGTAGDPRGDGQVTVENAVVMGERFDRVQAKLRYSSAGIDVTDAVAESGKARLLASGAWTHPAGQWKTGSVNLTFRTEGWTLQNVDHVRQFRPGVAGQFDAKGAGVLSVRDGLILPQRVDGDLAIRNLSVDGRALGDFNANARTEGQQLTVGVAGVLRGAKVAGNGAWQLTGDFPGSGSLTVAPMTLGTVQDLVFAAQGREPLPLDGFVSGTVKVSGPLRKPEQLRARAEVPVLEVVPSRRSLTQRQTTELSLRNNGPIILEYDGKGVEVRQAHMVGRETDLRLAGSLQTSGKPGWDLKVNGNLNLGVLQAFNQDVVSGGVAVVNASVRGSMQDPQLAGRMELKNASFYLSDFPNGLDNVNGTILFDQRRANIEKLRANTGGGDLGLTGFVGFGGSEFVFQLQGRADRVRIRYPEGVSTTANASLTLTGTSSRTLVSGVVTIVRAGFNTRTDIGGLLASNPIPTVAPALQNPFLRGMQFDVRVDTVPNLQFQTSLTSNLQAEADLRLRGTAAKPVLLGRVVVSQGDIQFFGNRYTINRGEIGFFNPVRIEPVLDMNLETRVRGVLVNIAFNGQLNKLNVSYRSDPPLQSTEIIALLAVGRAPGSNSVLSSSQGLAASQGVLGGATTNSLLGQAVAAPLSSRLQRFFGVSRLKIDPQLTGLSAVPQARLTIEQQISRDVTLTYVTNLSQANQQIMRLEWDINRSWSVVAVREENGVFGVDFFFKKRFK